MNLIDLLRLGVLLIDDVLGNPDLRSELRMSDPRVRVDFYSYAFTKGGLTANQIRAMEDLPPLPPVVVCY